MTSLGASYIYIPVNSFFKIQTPHSVTKNDYIRRIVRRRWGKLVSIQPDLSYAIRDLGFYCMQSYSESCFVCVSGGVV